MDYHEISKLTVGKLREMAGEYEDLEGVSGMSKEKLIEVLCGKLSIEIPHVEVSGVDKAGIKAQIRELKKVRDEALEAKDHAKLKQTRRKIHRLKHTLRKAAHVVGA